MSLVHEIPQEFTDEDKWFVFFTKKNLAFALPGVIITFINFKVFGFFGKSLVGVVIGLIITAILVAISKVPMPESEYLKGGGLTFDQLLVRRYIRKKNKKIYVKGY